MSAEALNLTVTERSLAVASAEIKAAKEGTTYWINMESKGERLTEVSVRAGILGDEAASKIVHNAIEARL